MPRGYSAARRELRAIIDELGPKAIREVILQKSHPKRVDAIRFAYEWAYGKARERHEHSGPGGSAIPIHTTRDYSKLTDAELEALSALLGRIESGSDPVPADE